MLYTSFKVKEWNPQEYAEYNERKPEVEEQKAGWITLLRNAPTMFWKVGLVQFFCWAAFMYMWTYTNGTIAETVWQTTDTASAQYQEAGNWVGVLFFWQAIGSVIWAMLLPKIPNGKLAYAISLLIGAAGFAALPFIADKNLLIIPFLLIGCAWAAMLAMPFTFVTNALEGYGHKGAYLGLFNGTICLPQIAAAAVGGTVLSMVGSHQFNMMLVAALLLLLGALSVAWIKK